MATAIKRSRTKPRTRRTRSHIIADLSVNHFERIALKNGYAVEVVRKDYGYDLNLFTYDANGYFENGYIPIQLKATDKLLSLKSQSAFSYKVRKRHLNIWSTEPYPVFLVLYDAQNERAYWLYVQHHLQAMKSLKLNRVKSTKQLRIPMTQVLDEPALRKMRDAKVNVLKQIESVIRH